MQQLKSNFYKVFSQKEEKQFKLLWSTFFTQFSYNQECEYFELGRFLLSLILQTKTSRHDKLYFIFHLVTHYQNSNGKTLTSESVQSILEELYLSLGFVNPYPYSALEGGSIVSGCLDFGVSGGKQDITSLLRTWNFIHHMKFRTRDIILGDATKLSVFSSLFDHDTLRRINQEKDGCRIQIHYTNNGSHYLWSAHVDKNCNILTRGDKIFGKERQYFTPNTLTSECEVLYNSENILQLTKRQPVNFQDFKQAINRDTILSYLLDSSSPIIVNNEGPLRQAFGFVVFINGQREQHFKVNVFESPSVGGVNRNTRLSEIRAKIQQQLKEKVFGYPNIHYVIEGTIHHDQAMTYKQLQSITSPTTVRESRSNPFKNDCFNILQKMVQLHYNKNKPVVVGQFASGIDKRLNNMQQSVYLGLYRSQDCIEEWKACRVVGDSSQGKVIYFLDDPLKQQYSRPDYEVIMFD